MSKLTTKAKQNKFIKAYIKNLGNVKMSCEESGITRQTFYNWKKDEKFLELLKETDEYALADKKDFVESKLMLLVEKEDRQAIIHASKTLNRDRNYGDNIDITTDIEPVQIVFGNMFTKEDKDI